MATASWQPGTDVAAVPNDVPEGLQEMARLLTEEPFRVQFFQAVRMLQRMSPQRDAVGVFKPPASEAIRFRALPSMTFPPSELYSLEQDENGQWQMVVQFMGLCAAVSPMPLLYTAHMLERIREKDTSMQDFFDLFNHRLISFFYRGWEKYRFYIGYEAGSSDQLSPRLLDLLGLGGESLTGRRRLPDSAYIHALPMLGRHTRSAAALEQLLEEHFDVRVKVTQFAGVWRRLPFEDRTQFLGDGAMNERLGLGVVVGEEVWDQHGRIRISIGPMPLRRYRDFLPGAQAHRDLVEWLRFFANGAFESEVQLVLERSEVPRCRMDTESAEGPRLGLISWLRTKPLSRDAADATFLIA